MLLVRWWTGRVAVRTVHQFRTHINRFKLTSRRYVRESILADDAIARAVREHATANALTDDQVWRIVRTYIDEIVPYFNILMYYRVGYTGSRVLLNLLYRVRVDRVDAGALRALPKESVVVYLFNHRSNADYVLAGYALAGHVTISYAVGEWARVFPLEHLFKSFGAYFIRRRFREPLYHAVLERYVQLITRNGVTQGIFPEGGLSRDGRMRPTKIGLLDYILGVAREQGMAERMHIVPVALNYDRVLEDRQLLAELVHGGPVRRGALRSLVGVVRYVVWSAGRMLTRRWKRYGSAAVTIGAPIPIADWLTARDDAGRTLLELPREERLPRVQAFADRAMEEVARLIPVTAVPLVCAALQTFPAEFVVRDALLDRIDALRDVLNDVNARVINAERIEDVLDRACAMLRLRHAIVESGDGYTVLPRGRELISYYANSIEPLLGGFSDDVRARDTLPASALLD
jgi:glycerol-3-phosphate O-acyltransferase